MDDTQHPRDSQPVRKPPRPHPFRPDNPAIGNQADGTPPDDRPLTSPIGQPTPGQPTHRFRIAPADPDPSSGADGSAPGPGAPEPVVAPRSPRPDPGAYGPVPPRPRPVRLAAPPPLARDQERFGWAPVRPEPRAPRRPSRLGRAVRFLLLLTLVSWSVFLLANQDLVRTLSGTPQWQGVERDVRQTVHGVVSLVAEEPAFAPAAALADYPVCGGVDSDEAGRLESAMDLMRGTSEGDRLFDQLVDQGVCVDVDDLIYNSGYAYGRQSANGSWGQSYIMVARNLLGSGETDVVAALLIHEATHIDRYINGLACTYDDSCTTLPNGVDIEEEYAAHAAEAQWWVAAYGDDGKRFATGFDYGLNQLARAWIEGEQVFQAYVLRIRSDSREGSSLGAI